MSSPVFLGAEVLGDSLMLRFCLRHADIIPTFHDYPSAWGRCGSGKSASELLKEQWPDNTLTGKRDAALIMIGTNDVLRICPNGELLAKQKYALKLTLRMLRNKASRKYNTVFFCTLPEIPRLAEGTDERVAGRYRSLMSAINEEIMGFGEKKESVTPIDLQGIFSREHYERFVGRGDSGCPDDVHLNNRGQDVLREVLQEKLLVQLG